MDNNLNNSLFGRWSSSHDGIKFCATPMGCCSSAASSSSSSSSSHGISDFFQQNLLKPLSPKRRSKKTSNGRRLRSVSSKMVPPNSVEIRPKRKKSSEKERQRNLQIKQCVRELTQLLPGVKSEIPRIRALRLANRYIVHLDKILREKPVFCEQSQTWRYLTTIEDFERTVSAEMQTTNSYKERAELEMGNSSSGAEMASSLLDAAAHFAPYPSAIGP